AALTFAGGRSPGHRVESGGPCRDLPESRFRSTGTWPAPGHSDVGQRLSLLPGLGQERVAAFLFALQLACFHIIILCRANGAYHFRYSGPRLIINCAARHLMDPRLPARDMGGSRGFLI